MTEGGEGFPLRWAWLIPAAGLVTVGLGTWGWLAHQAPFDDALYRSLALFEINNETYAQGWGLVDWRFRLARWTGAAAVFTSLFALAALMRQRLATALARWTKQQVVVAGSGELALAAFEAARRARRSAVWLGARAFHAARLSTIALEWPAGERAGAVLQHAGRADHVLIAEEDDAVALSLARAARAAAPAAWLTVLLKDARLAEDAAATLDEARTRVLSVAALAARGLMLAHPPFLIARQKGHGRIHALIVGFGQTGQAIARELIVNCRTTFLAPPRILALDPEAPDLEAALRVRAPEIDGCAETRFLAGKLDGRAVRPDPEVIAAALREGGPLTCAYVCVGGDAAALSAAAMLASLLRSAGIEAPPVFVRLAEGGLVGEGESGLAALTPFGDLETLLAASEFLSDAPDAAARAFAEAYRMNLPPAQRHDPSNRSALPWEQLDETYRQANRDAVAHIPAKLASAGADPAGWRGVGRLPRLAPGERLFGDEAELEALAELEHERWNAQRRMDGWRATDGPAKDEARRLHPSLRPYGELAEAVKEYDRVFVRQTAQACRAGDGPP